MAVRSVLSALGLAVIAIGLWSVAVESRTVHACTGEHVPPDDPSVRYVVGGWVRAVSYEEQHPINALEPIEMTYTFEVDQWWRGHPPATFTFIDRRSATGDTDNVRWGAMCGAMDSDPTDRYFLLAVPWEVGNFSTFFVYGRGERPGDPNLDWGLEFIADAMGVEPGSVGNLGIRAPDSSAVGGRLAFVVATIVVVILGRTATRPSRSPVDRYRGAR